LSNSTSLRKPGLRPVRSALGLLGRLKGNTSLGFEIPSTRALEQRIRKLRSPRPRLNLALQGGGAHGAFTWGVLDTLIKDAPHIEFEGLSGSSAGAMNAVVLADGWMKNGREGALQGLADFWTDIGRHVPASATQGEGDSITLTRASKLLANWAGNFSPTQLNPLDLNPLRDQLKRQIDFDGLRKHSPFKLFVGTTQANTGKLRLFRESELTADVLLASACLPKIHRSVEIDGEPYWDGGYSANPAVFPLFYECDSADVLLVLLSPLQREETPHTVEQIEARIAELSFSANFMREMRMFALASDFSSPAFLTMGRLERRLQRMRFHMIDSSHLASLERSDTKLLAYSPFLDALRDQGQERAQAWLLQHAAELGRRSTIDVKENFG
jgi:NTE family protein